MPESNHAEAEDNKTLTLAGNTTIMQVPQGWEVLFWGLFGTALGLAPALMVLPDVPALNPPFMVLAPALWACFIGWPVTYYWSKALHKRVDLLRGKLNAAGTLTDNEKGRYPGRLKWMPAWIGLFERAMYCILIGLGVAGGAAFIGVWVAMKLAGGWQVWSKGTMYGHAIFVAGLLGNTMSILFGVVAGLVIRSCVVQ